MASSGQKGRKLGRMKDWCKAYKARGQEDTNRKRKMRTRLRANPDDAQALEQYTERYGEPTGLKPDAKGKRLLKRKKAATKAAAA